MSITVKDVTKKSLSFPGSAWERTALQALPAVRSLQSRGSARQSLGNSAFPGGAWERESELAQAAANKK